MVSIQGFREAYPQFTEELFPDGRVSFFLKIAVKRLVKCRWDDLWEEGCYLYAAHYLSLEAEANKAKDGTGGIDAAAGPVTSESKAVGGVSLSQGKSANSIVAMAAEGAGSYASTIYGQQYWDLVQVIGAGALQA